MSLELSDHAINQFKTRKISKTRVIAAVKNSERKIKSFRNRILQQRRFGSKILEVVTVTEDSKITVITAYYLEE